MDERKTYRLPSYVTPERYQIRLTPDLTSWTFSGEETISIQIREPVREIILNAAELEFHGVAAQAGGKTLPASIALDHENERAVFSFGEPLTVGSGALTIRFSGILNDKLHGFYRSIYKDAGGVEKPLASTQFESTDARRAFPCWDEPAFKAIFQVTLVIDPKLTAISNARVAREVLLPDAAKKEVIFADSIKMSTYLVAFIVGDFEGTPPVMADRTPVRVWAVPGKKHLASFSLEIGKASLEYFSRYYGIPYPGDKLDLVAIPDFASGAMENLGAITFRETALLVDREKATRAELERVADVVSHENAHMWFGDLVTMKWWNGLWLNEAFATFMEMLAVDAWKPEWRRWESFTISRAAAMQVDGLKSTRAIEFPVEKPDEAAGMFDVLTYEKGASVLRMLEQYLGAEAFRDGIRLYLTRHAYNNAETTDLWDSLEESTRQPVRALMDSWIFQPGYPLINVERQGRRLMLSQRLFRYLQDDNVPERTFHVPVLVRARTNEGIEQKSLLLTEREGCLDFSGELDWAVVNAGAHGFYRVHYSPDLLGSLKQSLQTGLSAVERFGWVNDGWAAALAGLTPLPEYLDLLDLLRDESDLNVWTAVIISCHQIQRILDDSQQALFATRIRSLFGAAVQRMGWAPREGESELDRQLRGELIGALGVLAADGDCQRQARELFSRYEKDPEAVERNLVPAVISIVAHTGDVDEYANFHARFKSAATPQEETRYLFALGAFRRANLVDRTLQMTLSGDVRTQNAPYLMRSLLLHREARQKAWEFLKSHWVEMNRQYPDNSIPRMCEGIVGLVSADLEADARQFFAEHPVKQGAKQMEQHLERLHIAVACQQRWRDSF